MLLMDPDQALNILRESCEEILEVSPTTEFDDDAAEIASQFLALDNWIRNGGRMPKEWKI